MLLLETKISLRLSPRPSLFMFVTIRCAENSHYIKTDVPIDRFHLEGR